MKIFRLVIDLFLTYSALHILSGKFKIRIFFLRKNLIRKGYSFFKNDQLGKIYYSKYRDWKEEVASFSWKSHDV